jgi:hypothetical protein
MVVSRREAEGAATFRFQRDDATTQRRFAIMKNGREDAKFT